MFDIIESSKIVVAAPPIISITVKHENVMNTPLNDANAILVHTSDATIIALNDSNANFTWVFEDADTGKDAVFGPEFWTQLASFFVTARKILIELLFHFIFTLVRFPLDFRALSFSAWVERFSRPRTPPATQEDVQYLLAETNRESVEEAVRTESSRKAAIARK